MLLISLHGGGKLLKHVVVLLLLLASMAGCLLTELSET